MGAFFFLLLFSLFLLWLCDKKDTTKKDTGLDVNYNPQGAFQWETPNRLLYIYVHW